MGSIVEPGLLPVLDPLAGSKGPFLPRGVDETGRALYLNEAAQ